MGEHALCQSQQVQASRSTFPFQSMKQRCHPDPVIHSAPLFCFVTLESMSLRRRSTRSKEKVSCRALEAPRPWRKSSSVPIRIYKKDWLFANVRQARVLTKCKPFARLSKIPNLWSVVAVEEAVEDQA